MEPANLNHSDGPDSLERLLRDAAPRIADRGFSADVMAAVDTGRRRARVRRYAILAGGATGVIVAAAAGAFDTGIANLSTDLQRSFSELAALAVNPAVLIAALCIAAALVYVFRPGARDRSY